MTEYDEDGNRFSAAMAASDAARREKDKDAMRAVRDKQDKLRGDFAAGRLSMAEYAKQAREAGITAKEVGAALQERAASDRRTEEKLKDALSEAERSQQSADNDNNNAKPPPQELTAALAAKAQGLERLKRGEVADAAEAFEDAAALGATAMKALTATDADADASPAISVRSSSLLNAALCHLKLEDWERADTACTGAIALDTVGAHAARFRRIRLVQLRVVVVLFSL